VQQVKRHGYVTFSARLRSPCIRHRTGWSWLTAGLLEYKTTLYIKQDCTVMNFRIRYQWLLAACKLDHVHSNDHFPGQPGLAPFILSLQSSKILHTHIVLWTVSHSLPLSATWQPLRLRNMGLDPSSRRQDRRLWQLLPPTYPRFPTQLMLPMLMYDSELAPLHSCCRSSKQDGSVSLGMWHGWATPKTLSEPYIRRPVGCPRTGDAAQDVHVTPGFGP